MGREKFNGSNRVRWGDRKVIDKGKKIEEKEWGERIGDGIKDECVLVRWRKIWNYSFFPNTFLLLFVSYLFHKLLLKWKKMIDG